MDLKIKAHSRNSKGHLHTAPVVLDGCIVKQGYADGAPRIIPDPEQLTRERKSYYEQGWRESKMEHQKEPLALLDAQTRQRDEANRKVVVLEAEVAAANLATEAARGSWWSGLWVGVLAGAFGTVVAAAIIKAVSG